MEMLIIVVSLVIGSVVAGALAHSRINYRVAIGSKIFIGLFLSLLSGLAVLWTTGSISSTFTQKEYVDRALIITAYVSCEDYDPSAFSPWAKLFVLPNKKLRVRLDFLKGKSRKDLHALKNKLAECDIDFVTNKVPISIKLADHLPNIYVPSKNTPSGLRFSIKPEDYEKFHGGISLEYEGIVQRESYSSRLVEFGLKSSYSEHPPAAYFRMPAEMIPIHSIPSPDHMTSAASTILTYKGTGDLGNRIERVRAVAFKVIYSNPKDVKQEQVLLIVFSALMGFGLTLVAESLLLRNNAITNSSS
ncbi:MAG: hypothetical protein JAY90_07965 [Candidatus Thiodiazotropha lotti]|nr:hypothetical protein [Candidatus Thiodiazotropha lotti]